MRRVKVHNQWHNKRKKRKTNVHGPIRVKGLIRTLTMKRTFIIQMVSTSTLLGPSSLRCVSSALRDGAARENKGFDQKSKYIEQNSIQG